ncbi:hypothetical protein JCM6882_007980 [Rhodosporidiobolus microsporus]
MPLLRRASSTLSDRPPTYVSSESPPPPFTAFPDQYTVGGKQTLFLHTGQLKKHLKLLGAFHLLRQRIEGLEGGWCGHLDKKTRWAVFVNVAVYRLELFLDKVLKSSKPAGRAPVTPPLDVALALHSYMLNPGNFIEDAKRKTGIAEITAETIFGRVFFSIDENTLEQNPADFDVDDWISGTGTVYDPVQYFKTTKGITLRDPRGKKPMLIPWLTVDGTGYAQQGFKFISPKGDTWTHETLGLHKLAKDIIDGKVNTLFPLAGTFVSDLSTCEYPHESRRALFVRDKVRYTSAVEVADSPLELCHMAGWNRAGAEALLQKALGHKNARGISNILSRYTRGERFSLDLGMAILRQGTFIDKMHSLGWLDPGRFSTDDTLLKRCIARYHAFLDLLSSTPSMFCVPTLDIDLAWHTHQLSSMYLKDMVKYVGRFVDHDDKVEENKLSTSFDVTARAWQARFGVPYSTCGCPLPSQPPLSGLSRLASKLSLSNSQPSYPPGALSRLSPSAEDADATHASEHNALVLPYHPTAARKRRERRAELELRRKREEREWEKEKKKRAGKGGEKGKAWEAEDAEWRRRRNEHEAAFFYPVPIVPIYGPVGYPLPAGGNCCSYDGNQAGGDVHSGSGGCGSSCPGACATPGSSSACGGSSNSSACASCSSSSGSGGGSSGCGGGSSGSSGCGGGGGGGCGGGS